MQALNGFEQFDPRKFTLSSTFNFWAGGNDRSLSSPMLCASGFLWVERIPFVAHPATRQNEDGRFPSDRPFLETYRDFAGAAVAFVGT